MAGTGSMWVVWEKQGLKHKEPEAKSRENPSKSFLNSPYTLFLFFFLKRESHEVLLTRIPVAILQTAYMICVKWIFRHPNCQK